MNLRVEHDMQYLDYISMFLSIVKDKTVLELGSFGGWHTNLLHALSQIYVFVIMMYINMIL